MAASFIDKARIFCRAGKGGNGAVAFHREKYVSAGGPDGGDGGNGGNIVLVVDDNMSTLMDFRYKRKYVADNGMDGQGARKFGKQGFRPLKNWCAEKGVQAPKVHDPRYGWVRSWPAAAWADVYQIDLADLFGADGEQA